MIRLTLCLLGILFSGCAARQEPRDWEGLGKIPIKYQIPASLNTGGQPESLIVWRSEEEGGPFRPFTKEPMRWKEEYGSGQLTTIAVDYGVALDEDYFYYLEAVNADGSRRKLTPVIRAVAVIPMAESDVRRWNDLRKQEMAREREQDGRERQEVQQ